jgi:FtsH-binding integral membrane protein
MVSAGLVVVGFATMLVGRFHHHAAMFRQDQQGMNEGHKIIMVGAVIFLVASVIMVFFWSAE